jgi:hypothetical protein
MNVNRRGVELERFPDLVVIYLGMRANRPRGLLTMLQLAPQIQKSVQERPDGLLLHERLLFSCCRRTWACASIGGISTRWSAGPGRCPTALVAAVRRADERRAAQARQGAMFPARSRAGLRGSAAVPAPFVEEELHPAR